MPQTGAGGTVRQTLRGVLAGSDRVASEFRACFYREQVLREHLRERDLLLYEAQRDIVAARGTAGFEGCWRVDRVHYPGVDLPSGEPDRSTGHWNPAGQWEVFEVERGEVVMLARMPGPGQPVELVHCAAGSVVVLRPGVWHLTYAPAGPAWVSNAYTSQPQASHDGKYFSRRSTIRCGLYRDGGQVCVYQRGADPIVHRTAPPRRTVLPGLPPLAELFGAGHDAAAVARFEEHCARHS
jgi:hypothetical protein